ncbi:MAG: hypothetical protein H7Y31_03220 [Chitinophagaceae bacterium]|nr:hypothetical protein [Chitinophagaceae bacterium]
MKLVFTLIFLIIFSSLTAQRVGIGITNPQEKLHVDSNIRIGTSLWGSANHNRYFKIGEGNYVTIGEVGLDDRLEFSAREFLFKNSGAYGINNGKVGININTSPTAYLEVNGNVKITDNTQGDGKVLTSDASGNASWQNPSSRNSAFRATLQNSNQVINDGVDKVIQFDNEQFDDGFNYNNTNGIFTIPTDGVFHFDVKIEWQLVTSTATLFVYLDVNGSKVEEAKLEDAISGNVTKSISFGSTVKLGQGDIVRVFVRQESGTNQIVSTINSSFSGFRLY